MSPAFDAAMATMAPTRSTAPRATGVVQPHAANTPQMASSVTSVIPDVMSIDPDLGWLYVAAESSDLTVFDINQPGVVLVGHDKPGDASHTVAVDPATHRAFFPLVMGPKGTPVLRIMKPSGI